MVRKTDLLIQLGAVKKKKKQYLSKLNRYRSFARIIFIVVTMQENALILTSGFLQNCVFVRITAFSCIIATIQINKYYPYYRPLPVQSGVRGARLQVTFTENIFSTVELRACGNPQNAKMFGNASDELNIPMLCTLLLSRAHESSIKGMLLKTFLMTSMSCGMHRCESASIS